MFPGVDGFHWTVGHILFLSIFFAVVMVILATVLRATLRTARVLRTHPAAELCWKSDFAELPHVRAALPARVGGPGCSRICDMAFDCRECRNYEKFASLPASYPVNDLGLVYPPERYYHRGHTWVEPGEDGILTIGLDDLAVHMIGNPDAVELPSVGAEIDLNAIAWRIKKNGLEIPVRAPIEGKVVAVGSAKDGWYLKIQPRRNPQEPLALRHLLHGAEVGGWMSHELERLQQRLQTPDAFPTLADGGVLMPGLMDAVPEANWDAVLAETFLEV